MKSDYLYHRTFLNYLLLPLSWLYRLIVWSRKQWPTKQEVLPVPLIIIGNLTVGGNGKTPLIIALTKYLKQRQYRVGILMRGYGGSNRQVLVVEAKMKAALVGDEALMLAKNCEVPIVVAPQREKGIKRLVDLGCNLILSDDGLQRITLPRTLEVVVIDRLRGFGNGFCLPAGPLREPITRLKTVDFVVENLNNRTLLAAQQAENYTMYVKPLYFQNLKTGDKLDVRAFNRSSFLAIAAIGNPEKFFSTLRDLKLSFISLAFRDHAKLTPNDLPRNRTIVMTEKDSVKFIDQALEDDWWFLKIEPVVSAHFLTALETKLNQVHKKGVYRKVSF